MQMIFRTRPIELRTKKVQIIAGINLNKRDVRAVTGIVELSGKVIKQEVTANTGGARKIMPRNTHRSKYRQEEKQPFTPKWQPVKKRRLGKCYGFMEVLRMSSNFRWEYNYQEEVPHIGAFAKS
jgi:hypothetical protein